MRRRREEAGGYVAVVMAMMMVLLFGMSAFAVDVGNWYVTGQKVQRAADAGALGGVPDLPGDPDAAYAKARQLTSRNGYTDGGNAAVTTSLAGQPTRLRVTIATTVQNSFGRLFGVDDTTITRTAVADYAGPVPMGSPCNTFGNDPDTGGRSGATCGVNAEFWASVGSYGADKQNGDAYQTRQCRASGTVGCVGTVNSEFDDRGYFYTVTVPKRTSNLTFEAFDPMWVNVNATCDTNFGGGFFTPAARDARNSYVTDETTRYVSGDTPWCTGDREYSAKGDMDTRFTVRGPVATTNPWDPESFEPICTPRTYLGYNGSLYNALHQTRSSFLPGVADSFRRWSTLCTVTVAKPGDYLVQVQTNGQGADSDSADAGNRFSLRAYSTTDTAAQNQLAISGRTRMAIYANKTGAKTRFYLARIPSGAAGQQFSVKLFDIGESPNAGRITIEPPVESSVAFTNCLASGHVTAVLPTCSLSVAPSQYNGKWQTINVPVPTTYTCDDLDYSKCWVRLFYDYAGGAPTDQTTWQASLDGDPVRLVE